MRHKRTSSPAKRLRLLRAKAIRIKKESQRTPHLLRLLALLIAIDKSRRR